MKKEQLAALRLATFVLFCVLAFGAAFWVSFALVAWHFIDKFW